MTSLPNECRSEFLRRNGWVRNSSKQWVKIGGFAPYLSEDGAYKIQTILDEIAREVEKSA